MIKLVIKRIKGDSSNDGWSLPLLILFYRLDSFPAFFQYFFQFFHGRGSQHGDSRLPEIRNAFEDRRGGKVATGVENASVLVDALHVDAELLLQKVNLLIHG